jgi:hypothetical protein
VRWRKFILGAGQSEPRKNGLLIRLARLAACQRPIAIGRWRSGAGLTNIVKEVKYRDCAVSEHGALTQGGSFAKLART